MIKKRISPPSSSRGARPQNEERKLPSSGQSMSIDWVEFTCDGVENLYQIWPGSEYTQELWGSTRQGRHGYRHMREMNGVQVWWGSPRGDCHFVISGAGCKWLMAQEGWIGWQWYLDWLSGERGGRLSRLDVALDTFGGVFGPDEVAANISKGRTRSKWKLATAWRHQGLDPKGGDQFGTVYLGSPKSDSMMRCYDKGRQMADELPAGFPSWYRFEFQLRNEAARAMAVKIRLHGWRGAQSVIRGYVSFCDGQGGTLMEWWEMMEGVIPENLGIWRGRTTTESTKKWMNDQVAPAMARVSRETLADSTAQISLEIWDMAERQLEKQRSMAGGLTKD